MSRKETWPATPRPLPVPHADFCSHHFLAFLYFPNIHPWALDFSCARHLSFKSILIYGFPHHVLFFLIICEWMHPGCVTIAFSTVWKSWTKFPFLLEPYLLLPYQHRPGQLTVTIRRDSRKAYQEMLMLFCQANNAGCKWIRNALLSDPPRRCA